jgi:hypothetical protein
MMKYKKYERYPRIRFIFLLSIFLLTVFSCKNTTGPENETAEINITVSNECGIAVDVYMDKNFQFSVEYLESKTIRDVALGDHEFEAKKKGTETLLSFLSVELTERVDFVWTLESEASLHVANEYGETLDIYGDDNLISDIDALGTLIIENVLLGEHAFKALRQSDQTEIASITIDFTENVPYFWTVKK